MKQVSALVSGLASSGDSLSPPLSATLDEVGSLIPLESALHCRFPPSLHLAVLLRLLRRAFLPCAPDLADISAATKMVDYHFASVQATPPGDDSSARPPSFLGPFGAFFCSFDTQFPPGGNWKTCDAATEIAAFRQEAVAGVEASGWAGGEDVSEAVRTSVNAVILTRL